MTQQSSLTPSAGALRAARLIAEAFWSANWDNDNLSEPWRRHLNALARIIDREMEMGASSGATVTVTREYRDALVKERDDLAREVEGLKKRLREMAAILLADMAACADFQEPNETPTDCMIRLTDMLKKHPRATKLMLKRKDFVVVARDEPYFVLVYGMIRAHEIEIKRWTAEDEREYLRLIQAGN